jgi:hypothetical protein
MSVKRAPAAVLAGLLAVLLLAGLLLAGCAGHEPATGQVTGRLLSQGGGGSPGQRPMPGSVAITAAGHPPVTVRVPESGIFSVQLPPGRYHVSGPCSRSVPVTVTAHHITRINIICTLVVGRPPR